MLGQTVHNETVKKWATDDSGHNVSEQAKTIMSYFLASHMEYHLRFFKLVFEYKQEEVGEFNVNLFDVL